VSSALKPPCKCESAVTSDTGSSKFRIHPSEFRSHPVRSSKNARRENDGRTPSSCLRNLALRFRKSNTAAIQAPASSPVYSLGRGYSSDPPSSVALGRDVALGTLSLSTEASAWGAGSE